MPKISVDNKISDLVLAPGLSLGDVIQSVVSGLPDSRIITRVVFDGVNVHRTLQAAELEKEATEVGELDIQTADASIWAASGLDVAICCLERVQKSLVRSAEFLREENCATGKQFFAQCLEGLERFLEAIVITRKVLKLDFTQIQMEGIKLSQIEEDFLSILRNILVLQEKNDYHGVADKVDFELLPNLYTWIQALNQLRITRSSNT